MTLSELLSALSDPRMRHELVMHYAFIAGAVGWLFAGLSFYYWATDRRDHE